MSDLNKKLNADELNAMRKDVMLCAWGYARKASAKFGGKPSEYIHACVKRAWIEVKGITANCQIDGAEKIIAAALNVFEIYGTRSVDGKVMRTGLVAAGYMTDMVTTCNVNSATLGMLRATIMYNNTIDSIRYGFTIRNPEHLRSKLIAMGIENQNTIKKACNLSAQLYGKQSDDWDYDYTSAIYREIVDYCKRYPCAKEFAMKTVRDYRDWNFITEKEYNSLMYSIEYEYNKLAQVSKEEETNMGTEDTWTGNVVRVEKKDGYLYVTSPYNKAFIAQAHLRNARWNKPCWVYPVDKYDLLCADLEQCYGESPAMDAGDKVDCLYTVTSYATSGCVMQGIVLAERRYRDSAVKLASNVDIIAGEFPISGGSRKTPQVDAPEGLVLLVRGISKRLYEKQREEYGNVTIWTK